MSQAYYSLAILLKTTLVPQHIKYKHFWKYLLITCFKVMMMIFYIYEPSEIYCSPTVLFCRDRSCIHSTIFTEEKSEPQIGVKASPEICTQTRSQRAKPTTIKFNFGMCHQSTKQKQQTKKNTKNPQRKQTKTKNPNKHYLNTMGEYQHQVGTQGKKKWVSAERWSSVRHTGSKFQLRVHTASSGATAEKRRWSFTCGNAPLSGVPHEFPTCEPQKLQLEQSALSIW